MSASPATYHVFDLDGVHYRTTDGWRRETSRVEVPGRTVPVRRVGNRVLGSFYVGPTAIVTRTSPEPEARRHAFLNGEAGVWRADDSLVVFTRLPNGRISRRTFRHARPRRANEP